jgi:hypothetical protein
MTSEDANYVLSKIENEGFDYCFIDYSDFKEIDDEEFHRLREAYVKAHTELEAYLIK